MAHELARATRAHKRECHDPRLPFLHRLFARSALRTTRWSHVDPVLACARAKARRPLHAPTDAILLREKKIDRDRALKKPLEHDARRYTRLGVAGRQLPPRCSLFSLFTVHCSLFRTPSTHTHARPAWPVASCRSVRVAVRCSLFAVRCSERRAHTRTFGGRWRKLPGGCREGRNCTHHTSRLRHASLLQHYTQRDSSSLTASPAAAPCMVGGPCHAKSLSILSPHHTTEIPNK